MNNCIRIGICEARTYPTYNGMTHTVGDHTLGDHTLVDHTLVDHTVGDHTLGDHTLGDHTLGDHTLGDHTLGDHTVGDHTLGDHTLGDHTLGDHTLDSIVLCAILHIINGIGSAVSVVCCVIVGVLRNYEHAAVSATLFIKCFVLSMSVIAGEKGYTVCLL